MNLQDLVNRYINRPVSAVWDRVDPADSEQVDEAIDRVARIWEQGAKRIERETGHKL